MRLSRKRPPAPLAQPRIPTWSPVSWDRSISSGCMSTMAPAHRSVETRCDQGRPRCHCPHSVTWTGITLSRTPLISSRRDGILERQVSSANRRPASDQMRASTSMKTEGLGPDGQPALIRYLTYDGDKHTHTHTHMEKGRERERDHTDLAASGFLMRVAQSRSCGLEGRFPCFRDGAILPWHSGRWAASPPPRSVHSGCRAARERFTRAGRTADGA